MRTIAIIDYDSGNLRSAAKAFARVADKTDEVLIVRSPSELKDASHIVLPGVGAFADCMRGLLAIEGMRETLEKEVRGKGKPFLGICVGMQLLFEEGHEHGTHKGLGWIEGEVVKITGAGLKIPHMGWNELMPVAENPLMQGIEPGSHAYFVHSYHAQCRRAEDVVATTNYGQPIAAVVVNDNIMGTQFHPEKSQETGLKLIGNFLKLR